MIKATVLYGHPTDPDFFEKYYAETHIPVANKVSGIAKSEYTKFSLNPDGTDPSFYRMAELYFVSQAQMQVTMESTEGKAMVADLSNFASGGVTVLFGEVDN